MSFSAFEYRLICASIILPVGSDFSQIDCKCELSFQIKLFCIHAYMKYIWRNVQVIRLL